MQVFINITKFIRGSRKYAHFLEKITFIVQVRVVFCATSSTDSHKKIGKNEYIEKAFPIV